MNMYGNQESPSMNTKEAAFVLGCSEKHVRDLCDRGELKAIKLGKLWHINRSDLYSKLGIVEGVR